MTTSETPTTSRDLNWIKLALQSAVELECSTLPLYLSALFSLEVQNYTAYNVIRSVAMEEMVHLAIAANMLAALGGTPHLKDLKLSYPTKGLPGGTEPDLQHKQLSWALSNRSSVIKERPCSCNMDTCDAVWPFDCSDRGTKYRPALPHAAQSLCASQLTRPARRPT